MYNIRSPSKVRKKNVPWWNKELSSMRKKVSHQYWMALRSHDFDDWDQYYAHKREYKYLIRKSKRNSWRNYCSELSNYTDSAKLIRILKQDRVIQLGSIKKSDGAHTNYSILNSECCMIHLVYYIYQ